MMQQPEPMVHERDDQESECIRCHSFTYWRCRNRRVKKSISNADNLFLDMLQSTVVFKMDKEGENTDVVPTICRTDKTQKSNGVGRSALMTVRRQP